MNNPFKLVYDAAIERGEDEYTACNSAKAVYANCVSLLCNESYEDAFVVNRLKEYTLQLNEVLKT
jgi:hypothetical protein